MSLLFAGSTDRQAEPAPKERPVERVLLRPEEAAHALAISRSKVYQLMAARRLGSVLVGGSRRVPIEAIDEFVLRLREEAAE